MLINISYNLVRNDAFPGVEPLRLCYKKPVVGRTLQEIAYICPAAGCPAINYIIMNLTFPSDDLLLKAIPLRHSVRAYTDTPISADIVDCLRAEIDGINAANGTSMKLVTGETTAFDCFWAHYGKFSNVASYIIVSGPKGDDFSRVLGFEGERLVLAAQALGLNTCWVGLSYKKSTADFDVPEGHKIRCVIAIGYGATQGTPRKSKTEAEVSRTPGPAPRWFTKAIDAVLMAPTAVNQQRFRFTLRDDGLTVAEPRFSLVGYTQIDLGIAVCHFILQAPGHDVQWRLK